VAHASGTLTREGVSISHSLLKESPPGDMDGEKKKKEKSASSTATRARNSAVDNKRQVHCNGNSFHDP
jgi:hypothetical protein